MRKTLIFLMLLPLTSCGVGILEGTTAQQHQGALQIPARGASDTLDLGQWNVEWFGSPSLGPVDDELQRANVRDVILGTDLDLWALVEVSSRGQFEALLAELPAYRGLAADDERVEHQGHYYRGESQRPALIFKQSLVVKGARLILEESAADFAGRPPLLVELGVPTDSGTLDLVVIVVHMKATGSGAAWQRRHDAAVALKAYLDARDRGEAMVVLGDWNDDVDVSITPAAASPFEPFLQDPARYLFVTQALSAAGISSSVSYAELIDHQLVSDELAARLLAGSVEVFPANVLVPDFQDTTSDHLPVLARYQLDGSVPPPPPPPPPPHWVALDSPRGGEAFFAFDAAELRWRAEGVGQVALDFSDDGQSWTAIATVPAGDGHYGWTVPELETSQARIRVRDASDPSVADESAQAFSIALPDAGPQLIFPLGGSFSAGSAVGIRWSAERLESVRVDYSLDGGGTWTTIADRYPAYQGGLRWVVPNASTSDARVRVSDAANPARAAQSGDLTFIAIAPLHPKVIINEVLANEPGSDTGEEFVQLYNASAEAMDLGGWTLVKFAPRHVFAAGTVLAPGRAVVVFGSASAIPADLTNAVAASTGRLSLSNDDGRVVLLDAAGAEHDRFYYPFAEEGISHNRSPDGRPQAAVDLHTRLSARERSPGKAADGNDFGSRPLPTTITLESEPNDSPALAEGDLGSGIAIEGTLGAYLADEDWFRVVVLASGELRVTLQSFWSWDQEPLEATLFAEDNLEQELGTSFGAYPLARNVAPGQYLVRVAGSYGGSSSPRTQTATYALTVLTPAALPY